MAAETDRQGGPRLMRGVEAIAEAACRAGMRSAFGAPVPGLAELFDYLARRPPSPSTAGAAAAAGASAATDSEGGPGSGASKETKEARNAREASVAREAREARQPSEPRGRSPVEPPPAGAGALPGAADGSPAPDGPGRGRPDRARQAAPAQEGKEAAALPRQTPVPADLVQGVQIADESTAAARAMGAAAGGARVLVAVSGPGLARAFEVISYLVASEVPVVFLVVGRGGPGFGNILPGQADYFVLTRGAGGDVRLPVLAPSSVQEAADLTLQAFDLADTHRTPVALYLDTTLAQMMEPVDLPPPVTSVHARPWAATGRGDRRRSNLITSIHWSARDLEEHNFRLYSKWASLRGDLPRYERVLWRDAEVVIIGFGSCGRVAKTAVEKARKRDVAIGLFRPITLWPFPAEALAATCKKVRGVLVLELSMGQMVDDVRLALPGTKVFLYGRPGGEIPSPFEVMHEAVKVVR